MTKPIFLVGLPQMASIEQIDDVQKNLHLDDFFRTLRQKKAAKCGVLSQMQANR